MVLTIIIFRTIKKCIEILTKKIDFIMITVETNN